MDRRSFILSGLALLPASAYSASRPSWRLLAQPSGFTARDTAPVFEFDHHLWMSEGYTLDTKGTNDLLRSKSGTKWTVVNSATPYEAYSAICPFGRWIYIVDSKVRRTRDGVNFQILDAQNPHRFEPEMTMLELNEKLHMFGTEAVTHLCPKSLRFTETAYPWSKRTFFTVVKFGNRIFIVAGAKPRTNEPPEKNYQDRISLNEVWSTANPENQASWTQHSAPPWLPRMWPSLTSHKGRLYLVGGYNNRDATNFDDTWRSSDGSSWEKLPIFNKFTARHASSLHSWRGRLLMFGGNINQSGDDGYYQPDIWVLDGV
jgi:hypothetical protein